MLKSSARTRTRRRKGLEGTQGTLERDQDEEREACEEEEGENTATLCNDSVHAPNTARKCHASSGGGRAEVARRSRMMQIIQSKPFDS